MSALDRAWPALPLLTLALAVLVGLVGVLAAPEETELQRIDTTVEDFARAAQERRGADACALLTPALQREIAARLGTLDCAATVSSFGVGIDTGRLRASDVVAASVVGARASVGSTGVVLPGGVPFGRGLALERDARGWRIAAFPPAG